VGHFYFPRLLTRACGAALASLGRQIALIKEFERKSGLQHGIGKRKNILVILVLFIRKIPLEYSRCRHGKLQLHKEISQLGNFSMTDFWASISGT
jgi:hypothetical protein